MTDILALAERLDGAARQGRAVPQPSEDQPLPLADAFQVQDAVVARRIDRGELLTGLKLGPCTRQGMAALGLTAPLNGRLTSGMALPDGGRLDLGAFVAPRAEVEIAFRLTDRAFGDPAPADPRQAVDAVAVALEIADSRYPGFRFGLADLVADNCCAAGYALGPWLETAGMDRGLQTLTGLAMRLTIDGQAVEQAVSDGILGDPWQMAAHGLAAARQVGPDTRILLSGSVIAPHPLAAGQTVAAEIDGLGRVALSVVDPAAGRRHP